MEETRSLHKGKIELVDFHLIHVTSGRIVVRMDDGSEAEFGPGDVGSIPPGHDAWVVGDEPFISIDFGDALYAKQQ